MKKRATRIITLLLSCTIVAGLLAGCANRKAQLQVSRLDLYGNMEAMQDKKDVRSIEAVFTQKNKQQTYYATVKVQGNSSLAYAKKNYTIKFFDDEAHEIKSAVDMGWGEANEYCLKANWIDKTHSRNLVTAKLAAEAQKKYDVLEQAPCNGLVDGFPVELYINDEFHGIYTWNIPKSAWQFGMDEDDPNHIVMCGEDWEPAALFHDVPNFTSWEVEVGPESEETLEKFARLVQFIMNSSDEEFKENFDRYLDLDAVLNYYVFIEFACLPDNTGKNMIMVTYDGEVWYPSLYDLDTSWGVDWKGEQLWNYQEYPADFARNNLGQRVQKVFAQELHDRYFELRKQILSKEHVLETFENFGRQIPQEWIDKEQGKWGQELPGYDISQIETYLDDVLESMDQKYEALIR